MKKTLSLIMSLFLLLNLCSCGKHEHVWQKATCTSPKTCSICGKTEGESLGHDWKAATCTTPKTCATCGETSGKPLGHSVTEWSQTSPSTCTEHGIESGVCSVCGETVERELPLAEHTPSEWEIIVMPTETSQGTHKQTCTVCGATLKTELFSLTAEELKTLYISKCEAISYDSLSRTPDQYKGNYVKFSGYVVQVCSEATSPSYYSSYRVATSGKYNNIVYVKVDNYGSGSRILEDDYITFYGTYNGLYSYKTVRGDTLTIPEITAKYVN